MNNRRSSLWVLGFDGGCMACTQLARQVEVLSTGRLTARNLREAEVQGWMEQALGPKATWKPTLFAVGQEKVRAWQRFGMAWQLTRLLGLVSMIRIARLLGESNQPTQAATNPSRRRFLKTIGGASFGLAVLFGTKGAVPLQATTTPKAELTAEPADEKTKNRIMQQAKADQRVRQLREQLRADRFTPVGEGNVFIGRQDGALLRTVMVMEYQGAVAGTTAYLGYGEEANGKTWTYVVVRNNDKPSLVLTSNGKGSVGQIQANEIAIPTLAPQSTLEATERPQPNATPSPRPPLSFSCIICGGLCGGLCAVPSTAACFIICGGNYTCSYQCAVSYSTICGFACAIGCSAAGYC